MICFLLLAFAIFTPFTHAALDMRLQAAAGGQKPIGSIKPLLVDELTLKGARGETLNFTLKATSLGGCQPYGLSAWKSVSGTALPDHAGPIVRLYRMTTMNITNPSYPKAPQGALFDPLLPAPATELCPEASQRGLSADEDWFWGELEIPEGLKAGNYRATLRVGRTQLPIEAQVWKMKMPEVPSLPAYVGLQTYWLLLAHYGAWHAGEAELAEKYVLELKRHRMFPLQSYIAKPPFISKGDRPTLDLQNLPTREQSFAQATLKHRPREILYDFPTIEAAHVDDKETPTYFKAIQNSIASLHRPPGKAMVYLWDEPKPAEMPKLIKLARIAREQAPDLKILVTTPPKPELKGLVDIHVPVMDQFDSPGFPGPDAYKALQRQGKQVWWYISCMSHGCDYLSDSGRPDLVIDRPSAWVRSIGWVSEHYGIDTFLYYSAVYAYSLSPKREPWDNLWDFSGNGDGTLFYPGRPGERGITEHSPVASIRLKLWRESSFDAEYIRWMEQLPSKPAWWTSEYAAIARTTQAWEHDYSKYQRLRDRVGEYLNNTH